MTNDPFVAHGIHPARSRKAALFALAAEVPAPVLADLIGIAPKTAVKWATLAARDWSQYAAQRGIGRIDERWCVLFKTRLARPDVSRNPGFAFSAGRASRA